MHTYVHFHTPHTCAHKRHTRIHIQRYSYVRNIHTYTHRHTQTTHTHTSTRTHEIMHARTRAPNAHEHHVHTHARTLTYTRTYAQTREHTQTITSLLPTNCRPDNGLNQTSRKVVRRPISSMNPHSS